MHIKFGESQTQSITLKNLVLFGAYHISILSPEHGTSYFLIVSLWVNFRPPVVSWKSFSYRLSFPTSFCISLSIYLFEITKTIHPFCSMPEKPVDLPGVDIHVFFLLFRLCSVFDKLISYLPVLTTLYNQCCCTMRLIDPFPTS